MLHGFSARLAAFPVFYVGQAVDVRRRLLRHLRPSEAKARITAIRFGQPTFFSAALAPVEYLNLVEAGLIAALDPACNDQHPHGSPMLVNLPPMLLFGKD